MRKYLTTLVLLLLANISAHAGNADVVKVEVAKRGAGSYQFNVTIAHQDSGWQHYADKWAIIGPDGTVLATRTLHHPHVNEQPFTRSLSGVKIAAGINRVSIRGHDSVHGYGGQTVTVDLPE